jgi:Transposase IS66 family
MADPKWFFALLLVPAAALAQDNAAIYKRSCPDATMRPAGEISRATLDGWVMRVGELLSPTATGVGRELVSGPYIQADETPSAFRCAMGEAKVVRLPMAIRQTWLQRGVRLPAGPRARRPEAVPGTV